MKLNVLTPRSVIHVRKVLPSTVETRDDQRTVAARDFYQASKDSFHFTTVLKPNELIKELHLPITETLNRSIYLKIRDRSGYAFAVACCSVGLQLNRNRSLAANAVLGGLASIPRRSTEAEQALVGEIVSDETFARVPNAAIAEHCTMGDQHALF